MCLESTVHFVALSLSLVSFQLKNAYLCYPRLNGDHAHKGPDGPITFALVTPLVQSTCHCRLSTQGCIQDGSTPSA